MSLINEITPEVLELHRKYRNGEPGGVRLVTVVGAVKISADLRGANLRGADLCGADLCGADLRGADLCGADLCGADLRDANLCGANLCGADLCDADLRGADLSGADLRDADLRDADLRGADLSGCTGLLTARKFMAQFERDEYGWIVYKKFGSTDYVPPESWKIESGAFIEEVVNPLPTLDCACGVNFGLRKWCEVHYDNATLWRCRIRYEDGPDICVPYNTDGKARCGRLELIEVVNE